MNNILRLQSNLRTTRATLKTLRESLYELRTYLASEKFRGYERDGSKKDWIAIEEIDQRLRDILTQTLISEQGGTEEQRTEKERA